jgi:hypothetical protein
MAKTKQQLSESFAVVLMKCKLGEENAIRQAINTERKTPDRHGEFHVCLRGAAKHDCARDKVVLLSAAYCFGPFDFLFVVRSREVHFIERFVVECVRGGGDRIDDTHTIIGLTI